MPRGNTIGVKHIGDKLSILPRKELIIYSTHNLGFFLSNNNLALGIYFSLYSVIFHRTILFFLKGYSNCPLRRKCQRNLITQKKPAIQRILNTPMGQIPCIAGFLDTNNKRIDRSIVSMLRSNFGAPEWIRTTDLQFRKLLLYPAELRKHHTNDSRNRFS